MTSRVGGHIVAYTYCIQSVTDMPLTEDQIPCSYLRNILPY